MKYDTIEKFSNCLIQHGKLNDRIYLIKWNNCKDKDIVSKLDDFAILKGYTKIFCKIPQSSADIFIDAGYREEARIPDYFKTLGDALFLSKFFSEKREYDPDKEKREKILSFAKGRVYEKDRILNSDFKVEKAKKEDAHNLASLYREVFLSYPFPIHEPSYIEKTMCSNVNYYFISSDGKIVAASSAEKDAENSNAEMTDFAILPEFRRKGFAQYLLKHMEQDIYREGIDSFHTIARSLSKGMNITFSKVGYNYSGTLINNTFIAGSIESMNLWYKKG